MRKLSFLLALVMVLVLFAACGGGDSSVVAPAGGSSEAGGEVSSEAPAGGGETVTITMMALNDTTGTVNDIIAATEAHFGNVKIELQEVPGNSDDMKKSLITSLAAGSDEPDIFMMDVIWTTQFASAGWLADLSDAYDPNDYLDGPVSTVTYNDKRWAVPCYTDVQALYYRTDILDAPPTSWDEIVELCKEYQGTNDIEWGFLWQGFQGEPIVCNGLTFIKSNGGNDIVNGEVVINSPEAVEALEFMRMLIDEGITPEEALAQKPADQFPVYQEGKALFMLSWPGYYNALQSGEGTKIADKFSVAAFPAGPSGTSPAPTVGGWNIAVNEYSSNKELATEVAKYMCGEECQIIRSLGQSTLPTLSVVFDNAEVSAANPCVALTKESLENAASRPAAPDYPAMSQLIAVNLNKALSNQMSNEDALAEIEKGMQELLA